MSSVSSSISSNEGEEENSLVGFTDTEEVDAFTSSSVSASSETDEFETLPRLQPDDQPAMLPKSSSEFATQKSGNQNEGNNSDGNFSEGEISFRKFVCEQVKDFLSDGAKKNEEEAQNDEKKVDESGSDDYNQSPTFSELFALNIANGEKSFSSTTDQSLSDGNFSSAVSIKSAKENSDENEENSNSSDFDRYDFKVDDDEEEDDEEVSDELEMSTAHSISSFSSDLLEVRKQAQLIRRFRDRLQIQSNSEDNKDGKCFSPARVDSELETSTKIIAVFGPGGTLLKVSPDLEELKENQEADGEQKLKQEDNFASVAGDD